MAGQLHGRIADHVDHIVQAYQRQGTDIRSENAANGGVDFIHAERQLVVREEYLPQVQAVLQRSAQAGANNPPPTVEPVTRGIVLLRFEPTADRTDGWVLGIVGEIDSQLGGGIATPNHVLTVAQGEMHPCPATEPLEVEDGMLVL